MAKGKSKKPKADEPQDVDVTKLTTEELQPGDDPLDDDDDDDDDESAFLATEDPFEPHNPESSEALEAHALDAAANLPTSGGEQKAFVTVDVPLHEILPNELNANKQTPEVFNQLVSTLQEDGPDQPLVLVPLATLGPNGEKYKLVKGEHRWRAARVLGWPTFPSVIREDWDELAATVRMVKDNVLKGELDKEKFTSLVRTLQRDHQLDHDLAAALMGFDSVKTMYASMTRDKLEKSLDDKAALDKSKDQLRVLDDLALVLNTLFTKYGHTLPQSFMFFLYGGKIHLMIEIDSEARELLEEVGRVATERKIDINLLLGTMIKEMIPQYRPAWMAAHQPVVVAGESEAKTDADSDPS